MNCEKCEKEIPPARLRAMPSTRLCVRCKSLSDESPLTAFSKRVQGALASGSLSDLDELAKASREMGQLD